MTDLPLKDAVALVTGGSGDIGASISQRLARAGAAVVVAYHKNRDAAEALIASLKQRDLDALCVHIDVTNEESVADALDKIVRRLGRLDHLVNNAGGMRARMPVEQMDTALWEHAITLNLTGTFFCVRSAIPLLKLQNHSTIVNVGSSAASTGGSGGSVHYAAAKAGLIGLTRGLAVELGPMGIRVNAVAPGAVVTQFHERVAPASPISEWANHLPLRRTGSPDEIANVVRFLVGPESSYMTGQVLQASGGMVLA